MGRVNTENEQSHLDRFLDEESERGSVRSRFAVTAGAFVLSAVAAGSLGLAHYARLNPAVETVVAVSAGKGTLTYVGELDVPKNCNGVFKTNVKEAKADFEEKLFGVIPITYKANSVFNGDVTAEVCNPIMSLKFSRDEATGKVQLTVPVDSFSTDVYRTNPTIPAFIHDNGALMAIQKNFENDINLLPKISSNKSDDLMSSLDGFAELAAFQTTAKGCGPKAWLAMEPLYKISLKKQMIAEANRWRPDLKLTQDDIDVMFTGNVSFTTQYEDLMTKIKASAEKHGVKIVLPDPNNLSCVVDKSVLASMTGPTSKPAVSATPTPTPTSSGVTS